METRMEKIPEGTPSWLIWHIYPLGDLREHETKKGASCWCRPSIQPGCDGSYIVVHNSLDGREAFEEGRRKVS
jgi:hypothetical protein